MAWAQGALLGVEHCSAQSFRRPGESLSACLSRRVLIPVALSTPRPTLRNARIVKWWQIFSFFFPLFFCFSAHFLNPICFFYRLNVTSISFRFMWEIAVIGLKAIEPTSLIFVPPGLNQAFNITPWPNCWELETQWHPNNKIWWNFFGWKMESECTPNVRRSGVT